MLSLSIVMDATEEILPGVKDTFYPPGAVTAIGGIPDGTEDGHAAVMLVVKLADGSTVLAQTTLALLHNATRALAARYPDDRP